MSWTSEHDPPASGSDDDAGIDATSIPDDGPLDPSVFDGLFDDLASDEPDEAVDNPLDEFLSVTMTGDLDQDLHPVDAEARDADGAFATTDADRADPAAAALDSPTDERPAGDETRSDLGPPSAPIEPIPPADIEGQDEDQFEDDEDPEPVVSVFDDPPAGFGVDLDDPTDLDAAGRPLPPAMPTRNDGPVDHQAGLAPESTEPAGFPSQSDESGATERFDLSGSSLEHPGFDQGGFHLDPELDGPPDLGVDDDRTEFDDRPGFDDDRFGYSGVDDNGYVGSTGFGDPGNGYEAAGSPADLAPMAEPAPSQADRFQSAPTFEEGPFRASPPIQHDPQPEYEPEPSYELAEPVAEQQPMVEPAAAPKVRRSQRVLVALLVAITAGGGLGIGGAMLLSRIMDRSDSSPATAAATGTAEDTETAAAADEAAPGVATAPATSLRISSLRFEAGPDGPELVPSPALDQLAAAIERNPAGPVVATIRTFTEVSAADDLALSRLQAAALAAELVELGADPTTVAVSGMGRSLLSGAQPVPNFVVPSAGLESSDLADTVDRVGPFAIGLDPTTGLLRPESVAALDELARAMAADPDGRGVTLAAYSFDQADRAANEQQAQNAIAAAIARLTEAGIDPARLTTIVAGDEPFAVPDPVANHIDLHWGEVAAAPLALSTLAIDQIDFAAGSSELGPEAGTTVDQLATVLIESGADAVIDVHSFDGESVEERVELSVTRAQAIGRRLLAAGVSSDQLRLHGGTSSQFRDEDRVCRVVVSVLQPPDQS